MGEIKVYALKVKQKSFLYHLPNSVPLRYAFQGLKGLRFLHAEVGSAVPFNELGSPEYEPSEAGDSKMVTKNDEQRSTNLSTSTNRETSDHTANDRFGICFSKKECGSKEENDKGETASTSSSSLISVSGIITNVSTSTNRETSDHTANDRFGICCSKKECGSKEENDKGETASTSSSSLISVSGIIKQYFSGANETSHYCKPKQFKGGTDVKHPEIQAGAITSMPSFTPKTPESFATRKAKIKSGEVGKRLMSASHSLQVSASFQRPTISLRRCQSGREPGFSARTLVFDVSDSED